MAMAAVIAAGVGQVVSTIAESSALRSEARQEQKSGDRLLRKQTAATRRDRGQFAVDAFASGLTGGSFGDVFTAQEIEDAEFLGSIKQDTQNRVDNLRRQATGGLIVGLSLAAATTFQGIAGIKAARAGGGAGGGVWTPGANPHGGTSLSDPFTNMR